MGLARAPHPGLRLTGSPGPPIPEAGLAVAAGLWANRAEAFAAMAGAGERAGDDAWSEAAVRRRADRVAFAYLVDRLAAVEWPATAAPWREALPAETAREILVSEDPVAPVDWSGTRRMGRWPPAAFVSRPRRRLPAALLAATLRWTLDEVAARRTAALALDERSIADEPAGLAPALRLRREPPLDGLVGVEPTEPELRAVSREGWPWTALAELAGELRRQRRLDGAALARELLLPHRELQGAAFHLAVFGEVLLGAHDAGAAVRRLRPIGIGSGPVQELRLAGRRWDLWFEAGGLAVRYGGASPYRRAARALKAQPRPLRPDIALIELDSRAVYAWECKHSEDPDYLGQGLVEALAYLPELRAALGREAAVSLVVPDTAARTNCPDALAPGEVVVEPAGGVREGVRRLLEDAVAVSRVGRTRPSARAGH